MSQPGFAAYKTYLAVKSHFTSNYDFFKYQGKIVAKETSFNQRKDRFFFEKIERLHRKELVEFFVSNLILDEKAWIGSLVSDESENNFINWKRRFESLKYEFRVDVSKIVTYMEEENIVFDELFFSGENDHPHIFKLLMGNTISLETFIIMDKVLNFIAKINKNLLDDPIWSSYNRKIRKYSSFIEIESDEYKKILRNAFL